MLACTGSGILIDFEDGCLFAVQAGVAVGGVINDLHIRHIRKATLAQLIYAQNFSMPAGYVQDQDGESWLLKVGEEYNSVKDMQRPPPCW